MREAAITGDVPERDVRMPDGTLVFTFATEEARDNWTTTASSFGTVVLGKGTTWVKVRESG
jgi:hypothetical protein